MSTFDFIISALAALAIFAYGFNRSAGKLSKPAATNYEA